MFRHSIHAALAAVCLAVASAPAIAGKAQHSSLVDRGRYLVETSGCNDCHTPGYAMSAGKVPEKDWLTGDRLGWSGAWGTTYPPNLRLKINSMTLPEWKTFARTLTTRPPMPYWAVNHMTDRDLEALWSYVHSLGPAGEPAPAALPPGVAPNGPAVMFPAPPPDVAKK